MSDNKDIRLQVRLTKEQYETVLKKAEEENRTVSNLIRTALIAYLNKQSKLGHSIRNYADNHN